MAQSITVLLKARAHRVIIVFSMVSLLLGAGPFHAQKAYGAQITNRSLMVSSAKPGEHNVTYSVSFSVGTPGSVGSIRFQFCGNSALEVDPCVAPFGFDALNATVTSQGGTSGYIKSASSDVNNIILTQSPSGTINGPASFDFSNIVNPTNEDSYYLRVITYGTNDATGSSIDYGAMAFSINKGFDVSAEVPPYLTFCNGVGITNFDCSSAAGDLIDFGQFSSATSSVGQSQIVAATNAGSGYNIFVNGTTMTSGNNIIPAMLTETSKVGTSQFGLNLRSNTSPDIGQDVTGPGTATVMPQYNQTNRFRFVNNDKIATATAAQDYRKYTISYVVNVSKDQSPGVYSTTLTYVCIANF